MGQSRDNAEFGGRTLPNAGNEGESLIVVAGGGLGYSLVSGSGGSDLSTINDQISGSLTASLVHNDSTVPGANVDDALNTLLTNGSAISSSVSVLGSGTSLSAASATSIIQSVHTPVTFSAGSTDWDDGDWHDESTNNTRITVDFDGRVDLRGYVDFASNTIHEYEVSIRKNGTTALAAQNIDGESVSAVFHGVSIIDECADTDYYELIAFTNKSGATIPISGTGEGVTRFQAHRIK
jgi:hypothetical protein